MPFDLGEMYSGLIPIEEKDPSRALFFVFQPSINKPTDEIVIWLNGGPGMLVPVAKPALHVTNAVV